MWKSLDSVKVIFYSSFENTRQRNVKPLQCLEGFSASGPSSYLGRRLQAVLQVFTRWIISKQGEPRQLRLPHADPLVQRTEELFHCGGAVEAHHLREQTRRKRLILFAKKHQKLNQSSQSILQFQSTY